MPSTPPSHSSGWSPTGGSKRDCPARARIYPRLVHLRASEPGYQSRNNDYFLRRRCTTPASPTNPDPSNTRVPGSGTVVGGTTGGGITGVVSGGVVGVVNPLWVLPL